MISNLTRWICMLLIAVSLMPFTALAADDGNRLAATIGANTVKDLAGQPYHLADAWQSKPVVLVFIRHFG